MTGIDARGNLPRVSVVIPTRDRPDALRRCLTSLASSELVPADFEVVVVDDGSLVPVNAVVENFRASLEVSLERLDSSVGPAAARNRGVQRSRGPFVAFIDDDCLPAPTWLRELLMAHEKWGEAMIGGGLENGKPGDPFCEASQSLLDYLYAYANPDHGEAEFFASCNLAVPRDVFHRMGGFDESYPFAAGEDRAFCSRWRAQGGRLVYAESARVQHFPSLGLAGFWRQHFRYGRGARRFRRPSSRDGNSATGFEAPAFYAGLVGTPIRRHGIARGLPIAVLMGLSQVATLLGFLTEHLRPTPTRTRRRNAYAKRVTPRH